MSKLEINAATAIQVTSAPFYTQYYSSTDCTTTTDISLHLQQYIIFALNWSNSELIFYYLPTIECVLPTTQYLSLAPHRKTALSDN